jgi:predicted DNA-binding transcriptional regulator YafY
MPQNFRKSDRTARLLKLQILLWQQKHGMDVSEIARLCCVSKRTVYRDLNALETELNVPVWGQGNKRGIVDGYFLPPITFTQAEAMNIFLAARLMQNYSYVYNSSLVATFIKLNPILPTHLREQVNNTLSYLEKLPHDEKKLRNFSKIAEAWLTRHRVTFQYWELEDQGPVEFLIEPYFIEPSILGMSHYLIAFCCRTGVIRGFKMDHIVGEVIINPDTYEIPSSFNINTYLSSPWDIFTGDKLKPSGNIINVKLHFSSKIASPMMETLWHPSQQTELQDDGTMIMTLKVRNTYSFRAWILRWGTEVETLEPKSLRNQISKMVHKLDLMYHRKQKMQSAGFNNIKTLQTSPTLESAEITDDQWQSILPFLPAQSWTGRPRSDDRTIINGIVYVLKYKVRWSDLPRTYCAPSTCYARFQQWKVEGVWDKIRPILFP